MIKISDGATKGLGGPFVIFLNFGPPKTFFSIWPPQLEGLAPTLVKILFYYT
jgi:hypothetical protein